LTSGAIVADMTLWGFWVLAALHFPASSALPLAPSASSSLSAPSASLALGLAVVAAAFLLVMSVGLALPAPAAPSPSRARGFWALLRAVPRLADPDAAGRPRSRAPSAAVAADQVAFSF
jgi:hypothetical protein